MEMWQIAVLVRIVAVGIVIYIARRAMTRSTRTLTLFSWLAIAATWTTVVAVAKGQWDFSSLTVITIGIGVLNGMANYFMWNANAISTSRNAFFSALDDIFAMVLTMIVVPGALVALTVSIGVGIVLCLLSAILLALLNYRKQKEGEAGALPMRFYMYASGYCACWGIAMFCIGYFAAKQVGVWHFVSAWYLGATLVTGCIVLLDVAGKIPRPANTERATIGTFLIDVSLLAGANSLALVLQYTAFQSVSQALLQPAFLIVDIIVPVLLGILIFKEHKQFGRADIFLYGLGGLGFLLVLHV